MIYAYHGSGRIFHEEAGLIVLLILALTTTWTEYKAAGAVCLLDYSWGLQPFAWLILIGYIWPLAVLSIAAITVSHYWNSQVIGRPDHEFVNSGENMKTKLPSIVLALGLATSATAYAAEQSVDSCIAAIHQQKPGELNKLRKLNVAGSPFMNLKSKIPR